MKLDTVLKLEEIVGNPNVAELLSDRDLATIGSEVNNNFDADLTSRSDWEKRTEQSMKLALQVYEAKSFPWPNASNIKFPLITIAALQYHARAYPALVSSDTPVKCRTLGDDPDKIKAARAARVEAHMSYQVLEEDEDWEAETDKVLITQPIVGCAFKKTYFDPIKRHNISENVFAKDLVVNYWTKSLDTAPRITHLLYYTSNDIYERVARKLWLPLKSERASTPFKTPLGQSTDKVQGTGSPEVTDTSTPHLFLEQHRFLDLDGDGYEEPYIVVIDKNSKQVMRIVARFFTESIKYQEEDNTKVLSIFAERYFTKFPFIPSPDGGFYDLGFGLLLGPLNDSINTLINQLVDAGTMANTAGGFMSKGMKMRGGNQTFAPLEWKHVESTGDDLRKNLVPLPVREPSQVLFTLLNLLINYGERIGGAVDILVGQNPGQNTPAETSRTMAEQGMKIFTGIFKRTYRSLRDEYRKQYRLNQLYLDDNVEYISEAKGAGVIVYKDYEGPTTDVRPAADPNIVSDSQKMMQVSAVRQAATEVPLYNRYEVEHRFLEALKVQDIDKVLPDPKGPEAIPPGVDVKLQIEQLRAQTAKADQELKMKISLLKLMKEAEVGQAKIKKLEADAVLAMAEADGVAKGHKIAEIQLQLAAAKNKQEGFMASMEMAMGLFDKMKEHGEEPPAITGEQTPAM